MLPAVIGKIARTTLTDEIRIPRNVATDDVKIKASKFMNDSLSYNKCELTGRNDAYYKYIRYTSLVDLYNDCLADDALSSTDNVNRCYIPREFRNDNKHHMSNEERGCNGRLEYQNMRTEMEILQIRRDEFRSRLRVGDDNVNSYFNSSIDDESVRKEVEKLWSDCIKKDKEHIESKWVKKIESLRVALEKDKKELHNGSVRRRDNQQNEVDTSNTTNNREQYNENRTTTKNGVIRENHARMRDQQQQQQQR